MTNALLLVNALILAWILWHFANVAARVDYLGEQTRRLVLRYGDAVNDDILNGEDDGRDP